MVNSTHHTVWNTPMAMQMLSPAILRSQRDRQFLRAYLDEDQIAEFESINADAREIANQLTEISSVEELADVLSKTTSDMGVIGGRIGRLMAQLVDTEHDDYTRLSEFFTALVSGENGGSGLDADIIEFHKNQLDEARDQRLVIAMQDFSYFEHWILNTLAISPSGPPMSAIALTQMIGDVTLAQYFFSAITQIMTSPRRNPALPILADAMYDAVANLNFIVDTQGRNTGLIVRPPQTLATLGYGYGRFEDETDEDVERFIAIIQELRHQEE